MIEQNKLSVNTLVIFESSGMACVRSRSRIYTYVYVCREIVLKFRASMTTRTTSQSPRLWQCWDSPLLKSRYIIPKSPPILLGVGL